MGRTRAKAAVAAPSAEAAEAAGLPPRVEHAADESAAESDGSSVTRTPTAEDAWNKIYNHRERKIALGGTPSRPIKEYRREDMPLAPLNYVAPPKLQGLGIPPPQQYGEEDYYGLYLGDEANYWLGELMAWESFLWRKQRNWEKSNEACRWNGTASAPHHRA